MDAEIWSHADIRNGRRLFFLLSAVILAKEVATIYFLAQGVALTGIGVPAGGLPFAVPDTVRVGLALGFSLLLLGFAFAGMGWARLSLGLLYLVSAGEPLWRVAAALPGIDASVGAFLSLANHVAGVLVGLALVFAPPLRAFAWSQANTRLTIPVPLDDEPPRRSMRRARSLAELTVGLFAWLGNALIVLFVLAIGAFVYGFGDLLIGLLAP